MENFTVEKENQADIVIALAGNPNVGKSTFFNALTGLKQHTGNWAGKTVLNTQGSYKYNDKNYIIVDLPGTYSLMPNSAEEEVARNFICFGEADVAVVICDATCLERNLNLVLQTIEISKNVIVGVNFMDEARKKRINIHFDRLEAFLGVPVLPITARSNEGLEQIMKTIYTIKQKQLKPIQICYPQPIEQGIAMLEPIINGLDCKNLNQRWLCLKLIEKDMILIEEINKYLGYDITNNQAVNEKLQQINPLLMNQNLTKNALMDQVVSSIVLTAEKISNQAVSFEKSDYNLRDRKIDKWFTSKLTGIPIMLILLMGIFWLTITGANYPSQILSDGLFYVQEKLITLFENASMPVWMIELLVYGIYKVVAWITAVMLPPMAIFFPLFTLLEDLGYLPRVAFNLDKQFKKACTCGKQALTMCMGFGCNAAGVTGCRIIDSPRERLIAIITNNFVPCNGRFPTMIAVISMFFVGVAVTPISSLLSSLILTGVIVLGIIMTFLISRVLSGTILKGIPSSFTLELPPYRRPQIFKVIVRSILDRTLFVLARALVVAAPAGLIIWLMANVSVGGASLLSITSGFLDPFARLLGLDGVILLAFILGFPANEIVVPIIIMAYLSKGYILELDNYVELKQLLVDNGWTWLTAVCMILFSLMHWPCSTTCLTIRKETQSIKWTLISFLVPTITGMTICFIVASVVRLLGLI